MSNFLIDEETDLLAAEFVLGTLDSEERANAQTLLQSDHAFIAMVRIWERRFSELHLMVEPVEPDAAILQRIKAKVVGTSVSEAIPEPKPAIEVTPGSQPGHASVQPAGPSMPKAANIPIAEAPGPAEVPGPEEVPGPAEVPLPETPATQEIGPPSAEGAQPLEVSPATDMATPAVASPAIASPEVVAEMPSPAEVQPSPELHSPAETVTQFESPADKDTIPVHVPLPPAPMLPDLLADRLEGQRAERGREITVKVIRSRRRWRAFATLMTLLVVGAAGLLAAWRYAPERVPAELRPAELMKSIGIETVPPASPAAPAKPTPPTGQFDE